MFTPGSWIPANKPYFWMKVDIALIAYSYPLGILALYDSPFEERMYKQAHAISGQENLKLWRQASSSKAALYQSCYRTVLLFRNESLVDWYSQIMLLARRFHQFPLHRLVI